MPDAVDDLLKAGLLSPPDDFTEKVMTRLEALPMPAAAKPAGPERASMQWLALAGAGLLGAAQLVAFMFGIWSATAAG